MISRKEKILWFTLGAIAGIILFFALVACGDGRDIQQGVVVNKQYEPPSTIVTMVCYPVGKTTICNPLIIPEPEHYKLQIQEECAGSSANCFKKWRQVDPALYNSISVGDHWEQNMEPVSK